VLKIPTAPTTMDIAAIPKAIKMSLVFMLMLFTV
jgi:hypothetical protein